MQYLKLKGTRIAFSDTGGEQRPLLLLHGCGLDHHSLSEQAKFFRDTHRVVSIDLRGHGMSDAPRQDYSIASFAEDVAALCADLCLMKPVVVGHSMGGNIALELAATYAELPGEVVMIDSLLFPSRHFVLALEPVFAALETPNYLESYRQLLSSVSLASDIRGLETINSINIEQHVLASALYNQVMKFDAAAAASRCRVPLAYIGASVALADLDRLRDCAPQVQCGRTLGSGHFSPIEVPDQINPMILRFVAGR